MSASLADHLIVSGIFATPFAADDAGSHDELRDTRTDKQKKDDFARQFNQPLMFLSSEIAQFGVNPHPLMPITDQTRLGLQMFDPRTDEEKERDLEREAQKRTLHLFPSEDASLPTLLLPARCTSTLVAEQRERERIVFDHRRLQRTQERRVLFSLFQEHAGRGSRR